MPRSRTRLTQYGVRVNGVLVRKSFATAGEARKWQAAQKKIQDEIRAGTKRYLQPTLLMVHASEWLNGRREMASFGHQETWMGKYILARPKFRDKMLHELTMVDWKEVFGPKGELVREHLLSAATHNRIRATVHRMYEDARREYAPPRALENPIHDIKPLPEPKGPLTILGSREAIRVYLEAAGSLPYYPCFGIYTAIKLNTGLRMQNLIPLRWKHWVQDGTVLRIQEKFVRNKSFTGFKPGSKSGEEERKVGVNPALREALRAWREITRYPGDEDFICAMGDGSHIKQKQVWDANKKALARAGLEYLSEHKLRHTYATHYLAAGGNIHDLKLNLFHASVTTTEIYSHALESELSRRAGVFQTDAVPVKKPTEKDSQ